MDLEPNVAFRNPYLLQGLRARSTTLFRSFGSRLPCGDASELVRGRVGARSAGPPRLLFWFIGMQYS